MLTLSDAELRELTGYVQPTKQLAELHRQGFWRARRDRLGRVLLERDHYHAVAAGGDKPAKEPQLRQPRLKAA